MSQSLRGALIGCGFVAQHHLAAWPHVPGAELVAVCDIRPERLAWAAGLDASLRPYADAAALLAAERPDFVEICTRPGPHRELTELAASRGAHVLCQKPVSETREDLLAMIAACDRAGVRFMVHENWRFRSWYRAMRAAIDEGTVGRPIRLRLAHRDTRALRSDGFADQPYFAAMPRLILLEMGPHLIDTARYLMGEVESVVAQLGRFGEGHPGEDVATLLLRFESGAAGLLDLSWCAPADVERREWALNETVVEGTEAALRLCADGSLERVALDGSRRVLPVVLPREDRVYLDGYVAAQRHFIEGIVQGFPHETSGVETLETMDVLWSGYHSAATGREEEMSRRNAEKARQ
jgi:predicted dehydrogenase